MATSDKPQTAEGVPPDLLPVLRRSGVLSDRQFDEVRARVQRGTYPSRPTDLARRLIQDRILTEYQARRLLHNKANGLVVGKYIILDKLGSGSMGRVYKAHHQMMGRIVALKIIAPEIVSNDRVVARFHREMKLVGRLDHPNVVRAFDADQVNGVLFIVMEYVPGLSLGQRLRERGPVPADELIDYAAQASWGLHHAHLQGIVHRDVKPSNLLVGPDGQLKVLDLGLGVLMTADDEATFATADGIAVGTIDYMSPEQACGRDVDGRSDLYSLGCSMYHLLTGKLPFAGSSPVERLGKRINGRPTPITDYRPDLPPALVEVLDGLLETRAEDRFQSAAEVAEVLQALGPGPRPGASAVLPARPGSLGVPPGRPGSSTMVPTRPGSSGVVPARPTSGAIPAGQPSSSAIAPAIVAPAPRPPQAQVETVRPEYPGWFRPLASLAERSALAALLVVLGLWLVGLVLGFILGRLL
ncbi:MAG TPA: protein kinase [Isosphaeraceae bacterium]|jgi:serine/threonine-protein kinase